MQAGHDGIGGRRSIPPQEMEPCGIAWPCASPASDPFVGGQRIQILFFDRLQNRVCVSLSEVCRQTPLAALRAFGHVIGRLQIGGRSLT